MARRPRKKGPKTELTPWWRSFVLRFVGLYTLIFTVVLLFQTHWLQQNHTEDLVDKFGLALESIASTAAPYIPGESLAQIQSNADNQSDAFITLQKHLRHIQESNNLKEDQVYILRRDAANPELFRFVAMLQEKTFIGDPYRPPPHVLNLYNWVLTHKDAVRTPLFTDDHGTFISGLAPLLDDAGKTVAILQVDVHLDVYIAAKKTYTDEIKVVLWLALLSLIVVGIRMYAFMRQKVLALLQGTQAIEEEKYEHRVSIAGQDELASLAMALNRVIFNLKERFEMLKFLPQHTAKMIAESAQGGVRLDMGRSVQVAILESDIRGFTALSSELSPNGIIEMLNLYLRSQAEVISKFDGSIDKYMGDAVLAVFEGPDCATRALQCALALQDEVHRLNEAEVFIKPIHVGVGLAMGSVVMGNIGSQERMEHTVIGPAVNLAARLCSAAQADEVVASAHLCADIAERLLHGVGEEEFISAKGFSTPVPCYRLKPALSNPPQ